MVSPVAVAARIRVRKYLNIGFEEKIKAISPNERCLKNCFWAGFDTEKPRLLLRAGKRRENRG